MEPEAKSRAAEVVSAWGNSSLPPTGLATLVFALNGRPLKIRPMLFVPILLFASYANLQGFRKDGAGITAAASGTYALLALRRKHLFGQLITVPGAVRGVALGLAIANLVGCGWVYATADRKQEVEERSSNPRWME